MVEAKWKLVPVEMTPAMWDAMAAAYNSPAAWWHAALAASPAPALPESGGAFDLIAHLERQRSWSQKTFGPGNRTQGVLDHIRKELTEIEADPSDISEWIDVVILAFDGAWRAGWEPAAVVAAMEAKQTKNEGRVWPDWRTADPNKAIEHDRRHDAPAPAPAPAPVDAAGLVAEMLAACDKLDQAFDPAFTVLWRKAASALAAAAEREAALVRERDEHKWRADAFLKQRDKMVNAKDAAEAKVADAHEMRKRLDKRIHNQRLANRITWEIVEARRKWLGSITAQRAFIRMRDRALVAEARVTAAEAERDAEREACARIAWQFATKTVPPDGPRVAARLICDAIRARAAIRKETT